LMRLTSPDPARRPSAKEVAEYFSAPASLEGTAVCPPRVPFAGNLGDLTARLAENILASGDVSREDRVFPADPRVYSTNGVNLAHGISGVLHALHAAGRPIDEQLRGWLLSHALDPDKLSPGLFPGVAGVACVLSELGEDALAVAAVRRAAAHRIASEEPFMYGGAAGIGLASLWLYTRTQQPELLSDAARLADGLLKVRAAGPEGGLWVNGSGDTPLGLLYGNAGVSLFLLYAWLATGCVEYREAGAAALGTVLTSHVIPDGRDFWSFTSFANRGAKRLRHYWSDGSAGIAVALVRWLKATGNPLYAQALDNLIPDTERGMTIFPTMLLGMSGTGMFHLDAWHLLGRQSSLETCESLARSIALYTIEQADGVGMPGDQLQRLSTDFATGSAGVLTFLAHLLAARANVAAPSFGAAPFPDALLVRQQTAKRGASVETTERTQAAA
jgi:hypothetical protein